MKLSIRCMGDFLKQIAGRANAVRINPNGRKASIFLQAFSEWVTGDVAGVNVLHFQRLLSEVEDELVQTHKFPLLQAMTMNKKTMMKMNADRVHLSQNCFDSERNLKLIYRPGHIGLYDLSLIIELKNEWYETIAQVQKQFVNVEKDTGYIREIDSNVLNSFYPASTEFSRIPAQMVTESSNSYSMQIPWNVPINSEDSFQYPVDFLPNYIDCALSAQDSGLISHLEGYINFENIKSINCNYFTLVPNQANLTITVWSDEIHDTKLHFITGTTGQITNFCTLEFNVDRKLNKISRNVHKSTEQTEYKEEMIQVREVLRNFPPTV